LVRNLVVWWRWWWRLVRNLVERRFWPLLLLTKDVDDGIIRVIFELKTRWVSNVGTK
jgi:hypothetical protein